jgi:D-arabinose 1-dehydrogenase-like Zn-dependent alcohol dehydrogenase
MDSMRTPIADGSRPVTAPLTIVSPVSVVSAGGEEDCVARALKPCHDFLVDALHFLHSKSCVEGRMKSYDVCECGAPLRLMERPTPKPAGAQVLLKMIAAGVCHSDIHIWDGYYDLGGGKRLQLLDRGIKLPLTMGHENVGEVVALGPDAKGVKVGDVRLAHPWIGCGVCEVCRRGDENLCLKPANLGVFTHGGYADHMLVPHPRYLFEIGDLPPEKVAPLACSGVTTYSALKKVGADLQRQPVVIIGAGGLGLMCLALHKLMGGKAAIAVDIDPVKREAAKKAGAVAAIDGAAPDAAQQIIKATGEGAWAVIDLVGASATARLGVDSLRKGGKLVIVGLFGGEITVSTPFFPMRAMTIQGSYVGSLTEMAELLDLVRRKGLPPIPVKTRPLADVNAVLEELRAGKIVGRTVLTPA